MNNMNKKRIIIGVVVAFAVLAIVGYIAGNAGKDGDVLPGTDSSTVQEQEAGAQGQDSGTPGQDSASSGQESASSGQESAGQNGSGSADGVYEVKPDALLNLADDSAKKALQNSLHTEKGIDFYGNIKNDNDGKWKFAGYSSGDAQENLALDYYKAYFENDDEIHALINYAANNIAKITSMDANTIEVTILDHISDEEQSTKTIFSGKPLKKYWINKNTGAVEEIDQA